MDKKKFCKILKKLENATRLEENISSLCINYSHDNKTDVNLFGLGLGIENDVIDLLAEIMKDEGEDISYFCYELNFGKKWESGTITDRNGNDIDFSSAEKLYDFLARDNK